MTHPSRPAAEQLLRTMQRNYVPQYTYLPVDEREFRHLDLEAYRQHQKLLTSCDFRLLGDVEIKEVSDSAGVLARTFVRTMTFFDGAMTSEFYLVQPRRSVLLRNLLRGLLNLRWLDAPRNFAQTNQIRQCVGFATEFNDGTFLNTSNAYAARLISMPETMESEFYPYETSLKTLMLRHRQRVKLKLRADNRVRHVKVRTLEERIAQGQRLQALKAEYRAAVGWVTPEEMERFCQGNLQQAQSVYEALQELLKEQQERNSSGLIGL